MNALRKILGDNTDILLVLLVVGVLTVLFAPIPSELLDFLITSLPSPKDPLRDWQAVVIGGGIINGVSQAGAPSHECLPSRLGKAGEISTESLNSLRPITR